MANDLNDFGQQLQNQLTDAFSGDQGVLSLRAVIGDAALTDAIGGNTLAEIIAMIAKVYGDDVADMFADPDQQSGFSELKGLYGERDKFLDAYERLYVGAIEQIMLTKSKVDRLYDEFGLNPNATNAGGQILHTKRGQGKKLQALAGQSGTMGNFFEDLLFDIEGKDNSPLGDLSKIGLEIKSSFAKGGSLGSVKVGDITMNIPNALSQQMNAEQGKIMVKLAALFKIVSKMRNFLLIRFHFQNKNTRFPNMKEGILATTSTLYFDEILLFMILKIAELWDEIERATYNNYQGSNPTSNPKVIGIAPIKKGEIVSSTQNSDGSMNYKIQFELHFGLAKDVFQRFDKNPKSKFFGKVEGYDYRGLVLDRIYEKRIDLLDKARGSSVAFRAKLFGFIRHNQSWMDASGFVK